MTQFTALFDACVLYPAPLRDLLVRLARTGLFRAKWTDEIHDEWIRNLLKNRPDLQLERLQRTKRLMNTAVRDCLVHDYEELIPALVLPDKDDRHVLAAAICAQAQVIVTYNLVDFPQESLSQHGIEPQHPDEFVSGLIAQSPLLVCQTVQQQRLGLVKPPTSIEELLSIYEEQNLTQTVKQLQNYLQLL